MSVSLFGKLARFFMESCVYSIYYGQPSHEFKQPDNRQEKHVYCQQAKHIQNI